MDPMAMVSGITTSTSDRALGLGKVAVPDEDEAFGELSAPPLDANGSFGTRGFGVDRTARLLSDEYCVSECERGMFGFVARPSLTIPPLDAWTSDGDDVECVGDGFVDVAEVAITSLDFGVVLPLSPPPPSVSLEDVLGFKFAVVVVAVVVVGFVAPSFACGSSVVRVTRLAGRSRLFRA
jgi:hypothetical protein